MQIAHCVPRKWPPLLLPVGLLFQFPTSGDNSFVDIPATNYDKLNKNSIALTSTVDDECVVDVTALILHCAHKRITSIDEEWEDLRRDREVRREVAHPRWPFSQRGLDSIKVAHNKPVRHGMQQGQLLRKTRRFYSSDGRNHCQYLLTYTWGDDDDHCRLSVSIPGKQTRRERPGMPKARNA